MARSRFRSVRFDLEAAVSAARLVENAGGTIAPDLLAAGLGYSGTNNGTYLARLANARTFGLLAGRGERIELTDRGRVILAGEEPLASEARRQAFLSVPLFRAVFDSLPDDGALPARSDLALTLCRDFGESEDKAPLVAAKLLDSARQAGVAQVGPSGNLQFKGLSASFTTVENSFSAPLWARVVKFGRTRSGEKSPSTAGVPGGDVNDDQMWLEEGSEKSPGAPAGVSPWRRAGVVAAAVACLALVAVPVGVALTGSSAHPAAQGRHPEVDKSKVLGSGPAEHEVLGALSATTDSGSFDFAYTLKSTPPTQTVPTTTSTTVCHTLQVPGPTGGMMAPAQIAGTTGGGVIVGNSSTGSASASAAPRSTVVPKSKKKTVTTVPPTVSPSGPGVPTHMSVSSGPSGSGTQTVTECTGGPVANPGTPVSGTGVSNTSPKATLIDATVGAGASSAGGGLKVSLRVNSTTLYEDLGNTLETGLAPPPSQATAPGQPISGFAGITESTIGNREGAIAMIGMASPTGYLDLYQQDINGATQSGTSTLNGVPVTVYQVAVDPTQFASQPDITAVESQTATTATALLHSEGYTGTTDEISIDTSGFIREVNSVAHFSDGGTVVLDVTLSNFGCAGTVLMPGQTGANDPPSGCTSPDTGLPPTAPSSSGSAIVPSTSTTSVTPTAPPTIPSAAVAPTTIPPATTSTGPTTTSTVAPTTTSTG